MKLGEALSLAARKRQELNDRQGRILANAIAVEGDSSPENADTLIDAFDATSTDYSDLMKRIALTNATATSTTGVAMIALLHEREDLRRRRNLHEKAANAATPSTNRAYRFSTSERPLMAQINVQAHRTIVEQIDELLRTLDAVIQESNWQIDLVD